MRMLQHSERDSISNRLLGSARAPRAGDGALAIASFCTTTLGSRDNHTKEVAAGRRDQHARARTVPRQSQAFDTNAPQQLQPR